MINNKDLEALDVKDKILFIKTNNPQGVMDKNLREQLYNVGCWGVICIDRDAEVESMGLPALERLVEDLKKLHKKGEDNEGN